MSTLGDIPIKIESEAAFTEETLTGMADAVLREIQEHLVNLRDTGAAHIIDMRSLPLTQADRTALKHALGEGEVRISIDASGPTEIYETAYGGVWWVDYQDLLGSSAIQQIEIATIPALVPTHPDDVAGAAARLARDLQERDQETAT